MFETLKGLDWLEPWELLGEERSQFMERELSGEVSGRHVLFGRSCVAIAARLDRDDVLFLVDDLRLAIVHLTWKLETRPEWQRAKFVGLEEFKARMAQSHANCV